MRRYLMVLMVVCGLALAGCYGCKTGEKYDLDGPLTDTNGVVVPAPDYGVAK